MSSDIRCPILLFPDKSNETATAVATTYLDTAVLPYEPTENLRVAALENRVREKVKKIAQDDQPHAWYGLDSSIIVDIYQVR